MGLRLKLFIPLLLASHLFIAYIYLLWIPNFLTAEESVLLGASERHLKSVVEGLIPLLLGNQLDAVYGNLDALLENNTDWMSIQLFNADEQLLYPLVPIQVETNNKDFRNLTKEIRFLNQKLGDLKVQVDFTFRLNEIRKRSYLLICTFLAVLLIFFFATGMLLEWIVRKPIRQLADASQRIADGDYTMPLPRPNNDEVGILVSSFATMRDAIQSHTEKLFSAIQELQKKETALQENQSLLQAIVDNSMAVIYVKDVKGRYLLVNRRFEELFHIRQQALAGKTDYDIFPRDQAAAFRLVDEQVLDNKAVMQTEEVAPHDDGLHTYISVKAPLFDLTGTLYAIFGISTDITDRKRHEEEIRRLNTELQQKIQELIKTQKALVSREKLAILGQLSASVGHELRNPLGVMSNAAYFLKIVLSDSDERVREYIGIIEQEITGSLRIISDLLDFTRTNPPQTKALPVAEFINDSLGHCTIPEGVELRTDIQVDLPALVLDPLQIRQALLNLLTNAIQAMPDGGTLCLEACLVHNSQRETSGQKDRHPAHNSVVITVQDSGQGVSPENMSCLFQPLFTTKARGIGLGLVVCKNLVEANGGTIHVKSELGKGTEFSIVFPVEKG